MDIVLLLTIGVTVAYCIYAYGERQGIKWARKVMDEEKEYMQETVDGYCEYLNREYERLKEEMSLNRRVH